MPLYDYYCASCETKQTAFRPVGERYEGPNCCGLPMAKLLSIPTVRPDIPDYQSPIDGRCVSGYKQRVEDLKRAGCRPWEGIEAEKQHAASCLASEERVMDRKIAEGAATVLNNLSGETQRILKG